MKSEIKEELVDELLANYTGPDDLVGPDGLLTELKKRLINRFLNAELTTHLGYDKDEEADSSKANSRNGHSQKSIRSTDWKAASNVPRARDGNFGLGVTTELNNRGVSDTFICCIDGLSGFGGALESVFPNTRIHRCIVHMIRNSLTFVPWKERKEVAAELKHIYKASTVAVAKMALEAFRAKYDARFPAIGKGWEANWD